MIWLVVVVVSALHIEGALLSQKVNVTQLEPLDSVDLSLVVVFAGRIDALSSSVACNDFVTVSRLVRR